MPRQGRTGVLVAVKPAGTKTFAILMAAFVLGASVAVASAFAAPAGPGGNRAEVVPVLFVGNNWDGTADVIKQGGTPNAPTFVRVARLNIIPDIQERMLEIATDPVRLAYFLAIREFVGEGHDQYVDDMFASKDGRLVVVSRPSLADVVALDLNSGAILWRFRVAGQRSDHMAMSPDGTRVAVSASTGNVVHILDTFTGQEVGRFASGDSPHENNYSADGQRIYHASIGLVYTPADQPQFDSTKGDRRFQIVDANTNQIVKQIDMGQKLEEAGYPNMSSAVRPMALSPDERFVYFQVSFFHGFVEYDFAQDRVTRVANLPNEVPEMPREQYLLDSAHHGISMNPEGTRLCVAGTMSDYAAIVERDTFAYKLIHGGQKPYWSTNSADGRYCFVSWSGDDKISAISYKRKAEVAQIPVGDHPQRMRIGNVTRAWLQARQ
jgi:DNA-binding beta-propeller fold protein YncE